MEDGAKLFCFFFGKFGGDQLVNIIIWQTFIRVLLFTAVVTGRVYNEKETRRSGTTTESAHRSTRTNTIRLINNSPRTAFL